MKVVNLTGFNVIGNWIKLHKEYLHKLYLPPDIIRIVGERKEFEWLVNVE